MLDSIVTVTIDPVLNCLGVIISPKFFIRLKKNFINSNNNKFSAASASATSVAIFCLLLTVLFFAISISSYIWWRRRKSDREYRKRRFETSVPPLPHSKPYVEQNGSVSVVSRSRPVLNPITEEDSISNGHFLFSQEEETKNRSLPKWRESKLIQTSLPSLEAAQLLIVESETTGSSSRSSENTSPSGRGNDKEKLICSSSSSESSV